MLWSGWVTGRPLGVKFNYVEQAGLPEPRRLGINVNTVLVKTFCVDK